MLSTMFSTFVENYSSVIPMIKQPTTNDEALRPLYRRSINPFPVLERELFDLEREYS